MKSDELILLTGATGFLGTRLVRELLERYPQARLALLVRERAGQSGQRRVDAIVPAEARGRVDVHAGDVGLEDSVRRLGSGSRRRRRA